jgi:ankyrin repeat protein
MNIFEAIEMDDQAGASALLAADPALASTLGEDGATPVLHAMYRQNDALAHALAAQITAAGGQLSLAEAAAIDDIERVRVLLAAGEPVDGRTADGFTPLQLSAFFGAPGAAADLIAAGADVDAVADNPMRIQPLHAAAAGRHGEIATMLIAAGADVNTAQRHGWTPLHTAAHNGDAILVGELLAAGASTTATNDDGRTAAEIAAEGGFPDLFAARS